MRQMQVIYVRRRHILLPVWQRWACHLQYNLQLSITMLHASGWQLFSEVGDTPQELGAPQLAPGNTLLTDGPEVLQAHNCLQEHLPA